MEIINKIFNTLEKIIETIEMIFLVAMVLIIGNQVFCRYFLNFTPRWSEDVALILMVWFSFLGIAVGVKTKIHLSIEFFVNLLGEKAKTTIEFINNLLIIFFGLVLLFKGYALVQLTKNSVIPSIKMSTATIYIVVPITGFLIVVYSILNMINKNSGLENENNKDLEVNDL